MVSRLSRHLAPQAAANVKPKAKPVPEAVPAFMALVDDFVADNPVHTCLDQEQVRWAAAKLLLRRICKPERLKQWPGPDASRLLAILFILFAEEGLTKKKATILGFTSIEFWEVLETIVRTCGIAREKLQEAVMEVDTGSRAAHLVHSRDLDVLFRSSAGTASGGSSLASIEEEEVPEEADELLVTESAHLPPLKLPGTTAAGADGEPNIAPEALIVRQQLAKRYRRVRFGILISCSVWFGLAELVSRSVPDAPRTLFFFFYHLLVMGMLAATFPTNLATRAGLKLLQPLAVVIACGGTISAVNGLQKQPHMDASCRYINYLHALIMSGTWAMNACITLRGKLTWSVVRLTHGVDGMLFLLTTLALRHLGTPADLAGYPPCGPGCVDFNAALLRAVTTLLASACTGPAWREKVASLANLVGLNHVTLSLNDVPPPGQLQLRRDGKQEAAEDLSWQQGESWTSFTDSAHVRAMGGGSTASTCTYKTIDRGGAN